MPVPTDTTVTIDGLENGVEYEVRAINAVGPGRWSAQTAVALP